MRRAINRSLKFMAMASAGIVCGGGCVLLNPVLGVLGGVRNLIAAILNI